MTERSASGRVFRFGQVGRVRVSSEKVLGRFKLVSLAKVPNCPQPMSGEHTIAFCSRYQLNTVTGVILENLSTNEDQKGTDCTRDFMLFHGSDNTQYEYKVNTHIVQCEG